MNTAIQTRTALALAGALMLGLSFPAQAQIAWTGAGANNNLNDSANWDGNFGSGTALVFTDASKRSTVNINVASGSNRDHNGSITFDGDAFTVVGNGTLRHMGGDFVMDSDEEIRIECTFDMRRSVAGAGTGPLVMLDVRTQNSGYTFDSAATIIMNANRPSGFTGPGDNRIVNISGTTTVVALQGAVGGLATLNINGGATLAGSPTITPGTASLANHVTVASGARLSPGDNYHTGDDIGTLTFAFGHVNGRLVLNTGALFTFDLAAPGASDKIAVTAGGMILNSQQFGDFAFNALPGFSSGSYTLIESVATTGTLGAVTTGTVGGKPAELKLVGNNLVLDVKATGTLVLIR